MDQPLLVVIDNPIRLSFALYRPDHISIFIVSIVSPVSCWGNFTRIPPQYIVGQRGNIAFRVCYGCFIPIFIIRIRCRVPFRIGFTLKQSTSFDSQLLHFCRGIIGISRYSKLRRIRGSCVSIGSIQRLDLLKKQCFSRIEDVVRHFPGFVLLGDQVVLVIIDEFTKAAIWIYAFGNVTVTVSCILRLVPVAVGDDLLFPKFVEAVGIVIVLHERHSAFRILRLRHKHRGIVPFHERTTINVLNGCHPISRIILERLYTAESIGILTYLVRTCSCCVIIEDGFQHVLIIVLQFVQIPVGVITIIINDISFRICHGGQPVRCIIGILHRTIHWVGKGCDISGCVVGNGIDAAHRIGNFLYFTCRVHLDFHRVPISVLHGYQVSCRAKRIFILICCREYMRTIRLLDKRTVRVVRSIRSVCILNKNDGRSLRQLGYFKGSIRCIILQTSLESKRPASSHRA
ncbi:hypothetical protein D3C71_900870 [compost metagenome]